MSIRRVFGVALGLWLVTACRGSDSDCTPIRCADQGAVCGAIYDGCGKALRCGDCAEGVQCENNRCAGTRERACVENGDECGTSISGGTTMSCGTCTAPLVCSSVDVDAAPSGLRCVVASD
jgi:hypothetical protein